MERSEFEFATVVGDASDDVVCSVRYLFKGSEHAPRDPVAYRHSVLESYVHAECGIYLSLGKWPISGAFESSAPQYGVLLYWPLGRDSEIPHGEVLRDARERYLELMHQGTGHMERAVLVDVREFMQMPQGTHMVLPCEKRLLRFDYVGGELSNALHEFQATILESRLVFEDGELSILDDGRLSRFKDNQLPHEMIERRAQIVDDLANPNAPHWVWRVLDVDADCQMPGLFVELDARLVRVRIVEGEDIGLQFIHVVPTTREL